VSTAARAIECRYVIGADGALGVTAKRGGFAELTGVVPALEVEIEVDSWHLERFAHAARFDLGLTPFGYGWIFPKKQHLSVGVLTTRKGSCNLHAEYARYLEATGLAGPLKETKHGYMIPLKPRARLFDKPGILLVGDAAGLADPVIAEGISEAVLSGQLAARAILETWKSGGGACARYRQFLDEDLLPELRAARFLAYVLYHCPRLRDWVFRRHGQKLSDFVVEVVSGRSTYRSALSHLPNYGRLLFAGRSHFRASRIM